MKGFKMGTIKGIAIEIHPSWLIIFALLSFMLATGYFPENYPEWSQAVVWILSILMAGLLFASVLLHELSHSLVSKKLGIEVSRITLFIFGGLAQMEKEPDEPSKELKIAIAGPFMSIFLGAFFFLVSRIAGVLGAGEEVMVPILYAMGANFILAIFNLVPAFPLDGGRVFRALLWGWKGDLQKATKYASYAGEFFGYFLMVNGFFTIFSGSILNGVWFIFIGWFIVQASQTSYQNTIISDTFQKICVCDFMKEEVVTVPYHLPLSVLVEEYFYKYKFNGFPVVDGEEVIGFVNINRIRSVQRDHWTQQTVKSVMIPLEENLVVGLNDNVSKAMEKVFANGVGRVLVMEEDQLKGIVSKTDILNYLRIKTQLQK